MNPVIYFDELDKISDTPRGEEIIGILTHLTDTSQNNEFHDKYFSEIMNYLEINEDDFIKSLDKFRSPNLWNKKNNKWFLKTINGEKSFEI